MLNAYVDHDPFTDLVPIHFHDSERYLPINTSTRDPLSIFHLFITLEHYQIIARHTNQQAQLEGAKE